MAAVKNKIPYRLINLLVPCVVPLVLSFFLQLPNGPIGNKLFFKWFLEAAFELFCGPIPLIVGTISSVGLVGDIALSITLRLLTIAPFVVYVPKQHEIAIRHLGLNTGITVAFAVLGFLWLILSGV